MASLHDHHDHDDYVDSDPPGTGGEQVTAIPAGAQEGTYQWALVRYLLRADNPASRAQYRKNLAWFFDTPGIPQRLSELTYDMLMMYRESLVRRSHRARAVRVTPQAAAAAEAARAANSRALVRSSRADRHAAAATSSPLAPGTVNSRLGTLRAFLRWCHLQGYLPQFDGLRMLDHLRLMKVVVLNPHDALPEHDLPTFLAAAAAPKQRRVRRWRKRPERVPLRKGLDAQTGAYTSQRDHALFLFLHMTGIRPGKEASLVDIGDIIQERAADGSAEWFLDLPAHKTKGLYGARKEQLAPVVVGVLTDYLTATHRTWADTHSPLFLSLRAGPQGDYRLGERGVHFIYRRVLRDWIAQFGGDGRLRLSPHSMRHSFATWLAEGNPELGRLPISVQDLAKVMGHSSIATTQKYIDHANQRDVARRALLSPPPLTTVPMPQDPPAEQDTAATDA